MIKLTPTDDKLISVVLSGGYNVQPNPNINSFHSVVDININDKGIIKIDKLLTLG